MSSKVNPSSNEDLENENIQLVQLKDIQPSPVIGNHDTSKFEVGPVEFVIDNEESSLDNIVYIDDEGIKCEESNEDEESSVGNIVYIDAEDIKCEESNEVIIWDTSNDAIDSSDAKPDNSRVNTHPQDSWPTLEILPGGIIKNADTLEPNMHLCDDIIFDSCELLYACAKCPMKFKNMFYLVKHIKWHEVEKKIQFAMHNESSLKTGNKGKLKKQATKKNKKS